MSFSSRNKLFAGFISIILITFTSLLCIRHYNQNVCHLEKDNRLLMDTYVSISAIGPKNITIPAINLAFNRVKEIDIKFNSQNPKSPIYAFNNSGEPVSDPEILFVVNSALEISKKTNAAFDITIFPVIETWGFYKGSPHLPEKGQIKEALSHVGYQYLRINKGFLEKTRNDIRIDLGGIAKHYAIGEAAKVLKNNGVKSALIDAGGDIFAIGRKGKSPWKVGIRNPMSPDLFGYLKAEDIAVFGTGDYERFFIKDGKRYHHIFDPATGYPANGLRSVTLISRDPIAAMGWPVTLFILGPEKGLESVKKMSGMEIMMVTSSGERIFSSELKNKLIKISESD